MALLEHTLKSMADSQCSDAGIGVDTVDAGFLQVLNNTLGYEQRDSVQLMSKTIPAEESVS